MFSSRIVSLACFRADPWLGSSSAAYHAGHPEPRFRNSGPFSLSVLCRQRSGEPSAGTRRALCWDGCPQVSGGDRGSSEATSQGSAVAANGPAPSQLYTRLIRSRGDPVAGKRESLRPWAEHPGQNIGLRVLAHREGPSGVVACAGSGSLFPCSWACVPTHSPAAS